MKIEGNVLTPDDGKWLTNGDVYSLKVWLGINDTSDNWHDIPEDEVPRAWKNSQTME